MVYCIFLPLAIPSLVGVRLIYLLKILKVYTFISSSYSGGEGGVAGSGSWFNGFFFLGKPWVDKIGEISVFST